MGGLFLACAPFNVGGLAACVGAWLVGWLRGWVLGWLARVARQVWLGRVPMDGLAWWVGVGRRVGKQPGQRRSWFFIFARDNTLGNQRALQRKRPRLLTR